MHLAAKTYYLKILMMVCDSLQVKSKISKLEITSTWKIKRSHISRWEIWFSFIFSSLKQMSESNASLFVLVWLFAHFASDPNTRQVTAAWLGDSEAPRCIQKQQQFWEQSGTRCHMRQFFQTLQVKSAETHFEILPHRPRLSVIG